MTSETSSIIWLIASGILILIAFWLGRRMNFGARSFDLKAHNDMVESQLDDPEFLKELRRSVELEGAMIAAIQQQIEAVYEREDGYQAGGFIANFKALLRGPDGQLIKGKLIEKVLGMVNEAAKTMVGIGRK